MAYTAAQASVLLTDYVEPVLRDSFQEEENTFKAFMEGDKERTNIRGRRISYNVQPNPSYGAFATSANAALPVGGTGVDIEAKIYYLNQFMVGEMGKEVLDQDNDKAIVGLFANRQKRDGITFRQRQNLWMFGNGNGSLGVISSSSTVTIVLGGDYGSENIIIGSRLEFYTSGGVKRVGGGAVVSTVLTNDVTTGTITVDQVPNDLAATDTVHYESSYGNAPHGLDYHVLDNTGGTWLGINTATYPTIKPGAIHDADGNGLLPGMIDLVQAKARRRTGVNEPVNDRVLLSHTSQEFNYRQLGYDLFRNVAASGNAKIDLGFPAAAHNGMRWKLDLNCQRSVLYLLKFSDFAIEFIKLPGFYALANGDKLWQKPTSGGVYDVVQWAMVARYDLICKDRRNQAAIINLPYVAGI